MRQNYQEQGSVFEEQSARMICEHEGPPPVIKDYLGDIFGVPVITDQH